MAAPTPIRGPAHQALIDREKTLAAAHAHDGQAAIEAIQKDRRQRWKALLAGREEPPEILRWAADMEIVHGQKAVKVWRNVLPWITALYVVRYGEAEDFWPARLGESDLAKARRWLSGSTPAGVTYVQEET